MYNFTVSDKAILKVKEALSKKGITNTFLRVGVKSGGCSGYRYHLEYCDSYKENKDIIFEFDDIRVIIDKKSILLLNNAKLEYKETLMEQGFYFTNPIATNSCGCSLSFDTK